MIPYIGITGFMKTIEVLAVLRALPASVYHKTMIGVLASPTTLYGTGNSRPRRYPKPAAFERIFPPHPNALNLIHVHTRQPQTLVDDVRYAGDIAGEFCDGFQLNMAWPDPAMLGVIKSRGNVLVLQVGRRAFEMIGNSPIRLAMKIEREYEMVDYVLLDQSGGTGKPLDSCFLRPYLYALAAKCLPIGLVIAGGLGPHSLDLVAPLIDEFPDISFDAETGLRDENDDLDVNAAILYRTRADALFHRKS